MAIGQPARHWFAPAVGLLQDGQRVDTMEPVSAVPPRRLWRFANLPLGGGGLRTEAAVLNNPAARCKPTAGKAPSYGPTFAGRSRHAIPGLALPFAVILTAHRLRSPLRPARQTAWTLAWSSKAATHALKTNCRSKRSSRCFSREIRLSRIRLGAIIDTSQALVGPISEA